MSLPARSITRPVAVAMLFAAVVFLGLISFNRLPIDLLPDVAYPKLVIYTPHANVAPAEIERFVTGPVEQNVAAVPGVERVESVSREGVSLVTLRFAWGADMDFAALNVREKLDNLRDVLPERATRPVVLRTDPTSEPIMALSVWGADDLGALKEMAEAVFKRRLEQVDGVAQAAVTGGLEREIHVEVDPDRMSALGVTLNDVEEALEAANASAPGGTVRRGRFRYSLRTLGELQTLAEIADVPVRPSRRESSAGGERAGRGQTDASGTASRRAADSSTAASTIALRDIAHVEDGFQDRQSIARYNAEESVGMLLFKESGANTVRVSERVDGVIEELRAEYPDVRLEVAMSQAGFISEAIANVVDALIQGGFLAFLVLFLFLRDVRFPVAIALAIPISVVATFALLDATGVSLNIMTLGGLALGVGMLVDNSIVVLENIFRLREKGLAAAAAAARGTEEVAGAITSSTLTTIAVFGPIIYIEGIAGELLGALSFAVAFSLLASLLVAITLLPTVAARWTSGAGASGEARRRWAQRTTRALGNGARSLMRPGLDAFDHAFRRFTERYLRILRSALDHRARVVGLSLILFVATLAMTPGLRRSALPAVDQGAFQARIELPRGTPIEETAETALRLESLLRDDPDVDAVFTRIGRQAAIAGVEEEESGLNTAVLEVRLQPDGRTARVMDRIRPRLSEFVEGTIALETGQATALGSLLGGGAADLAVRIRGDDLDAALSFAQEVEARLTDEPALTNVRLGMELGQPEIQLEVDRERAAAFGVEPRRIAETIETYMLGARATELVEFDRKVPVIVMLPREVRHSLTTLDVLSVDDVPLREVIQIQEAAGPAEIRRVDQSRVVPVYADAVGRDMGNAITATETAVAGLSAPRGLRIEIGGENEEMQRNFRELAFAFALALLLVYMILAAKFESFIHPFTILLTVPLALVGVVLSLWVTGAGLNAMSLIGLIILVGIVNNDAIIMVDFIVQAEQTGVGRREAIMQAARARLRPIVMTTVTTLFGVLPMAIGIGRGADLRQPLAITVFGGLLMATLLTLIVIPIAYDTVEEIRLRIRAVVPGLAGEPEPTGPAPATAGAVRGAGPAPEPAPATAESRRP